MNKQLGLSVGEIAKYAIPINGLIPESENAVGEYAMVGYATDVKGNAYVAVLSVEHYSDNLMDMKILDVGHSVSGRIKKAGARCIRTGITPKRFPSTLPQTSL